MLFKSEFHLADDPIEPELPVFAPEEGAEVQFLGVVRETEGGHPLSGIHYSAYEPMALKMLADLVERGRAKHGAHHVYLRHRLGFVPNEVASIIIRVRTKHSAEAFELCRWYLAEVKASVPIWKEPRYR